MDLEKRDHLSKEKMFSRNFVKDFCQRNKLSFRKILKKKRSDIDDNVVNEFFTIADVFASYPCDSILNMDEKPWIFVFLRGEVLAEKGREELKAKLHDDYRKQFTVVVTICANGNKCPPLISCSW